MNDRRYDLLVYRDLTDMVNGRELAVDEDGALVGAEFEGLPVAAVARRSTSRKTPRSS